MTRAEHGAALVILPKRTLPRTIMGTRRPTRAETLNSQRKRQAIREVQAAVAQELAKECELPKTVPQRIVDLVRELHRLLRGRPGGPRSAGEGTLRHP
jgi:hypothetical protein